MFQRGVEDVPNLAKVWVWGEPVPILFREPAADGGKVSKFEFGLTAPPLSRALLSSLLHPRSVSSSRHPSIVNGFADTYGVRMPVVVNESLLISLVECILSASDGYSQTSIFKASQHMSMSANGMRVACERQDAIEGGRISGVHSVETFATAQDGPEPADPVNIPVVCWEADGGADDVFAGTRFERAEAGAFSPVACTSVVSSPARPENSEPPSPRDDGHGHGRVGGPAGGCIARRARPAWPMPGPMGDAALARAQTRGLLARRICAVRGLSGVGLAGTSEVGSGRVEPCGSRECIGVGHAAAFPVSLPHPSLFNPLLNFVNSPGYTFTGLTGGNAPGVVKPAAGWTAQETITCPKCTDIEVFARHVRLGAQDSARTKRR
ncbi:hypothetical protein FB451DRAFT_1172657 [Mycena latifolia]|nr:hypothetical protein FB451DRAFT_1172657 [Mycena latifolia]